MDVELWQDNWSTTVDTMLFYLAVNQRRLSEKKTCDWLEVLEGCGFPYGPINTMGEVFTDPQVLHNNMIQEMDHPTLGKIRVPGIKR